MPEFIIYLSLTMSTVTFFVFGWDKRRARRGGGRISERTLVALSWATGFVGGWIGMAVFRHKTRKTSFKIKMALVSIANLLWGLLWFATASWR
jgi:uncharacterized membrane protein YsdA (DUF1294 family)